MVFGRSRFGPGFQPCDPVRDRALRAHDTISFPRLVHHRLLDRLRPRARLVLDRGWRAVVTARDEARVADLTEGKEDRSLAVSLDVAEAGQIADGVSAAIRRFGGIDVLVNNAGYGYQSTVEEGVESEIRAQFDANVFGLFALTRAVLPFMRAKKHGHIINITSVAGFAGFPGSGYYAATKHAVEGWSDALSAEVGPLGIAVTCVAPGPFRTDWAGRSLKQTPNRIADYAETAGARLRATLDNSGTQGQRMRFLLAT